jgi:Fe-S cluster assembly protein SufB
MKALKKPTISQKNAFEPSRALYEQANPEHNRYRATPGLTETLVREISTQKHEPAWMLKKRLQAFALYQNKPLPSWGPDLSNLNLDEIVYFVRPDTDEAVAWNKVPEDIKKTFDRLGIPEAEKTALSGVGAQYDSDVVYHNLKKEWESKGVIFENMDVAVQKYPELVKKYFMTQCVPINDHKFVMLHAAVWSGGTFIYVPKNVTIDLPLQAYFRMNAEGGGQFEHTLIIADEGSKLHYIEGCSAPRYNKSALHAGCVEIFVHAGARVRYSSIENWSKNTYNLNTKRALVDEDAVIDEHDEIISKNLVRENHMMFLWQMVNLELWLQTVDEWRVEKRALKP